MSNRWWRWARPVGGAAVLAVLVWRIGSGPFIDGVRMVDGWSLVAATGIAVVTTVCCAWRWSIIARGLGVAVPLPAAVAAYYRSQFLNTTLPGGVLGDVDRAVRHGRLAGDTARGLRAAAWDRLAGQVVQVVLALVVLLLLPSPWRSSMPVVAVAVGVATLLAVVLARDLGSGGTSLWARSVRTTAADLHTVLARRAWPGIVLASTVAAAGHALTFVIAARTAGSAASSVELLPIALLVSLAMSVPANIAGWGPREGAAAWAFAVAGLGASQGVAAAVVYGVMVLVASLPGGLVLIAAWVRRNRVGQRRPAPVAAIRLEGAAHG